jgi:hypothetical protein
MKTPMETDGSRAGSARWDNLEAAELDRLWGEEAERRLVACRDGAARSMSAEAVYAAVERLLTEQFR